MKALRRVPLIAVLALCLAGVARGARTRVAGNEVGANGDHLTAWFTAQGYELLAAFQRAEQTGRPLLAELPARELEQALRTPIVVVGSSNRAMLRNLFGEVKDIRVIQEKRSGLPLILIDETNLTRLYDSGRSEPRIVLHAYLLAAGKDDTAFHLSGKVDYGALGLTSGAAANRARYSDPSGWRELFRGHLDPDSGDGWYSAHWRRDRHYEWRVVSTNPLQAEPLRLDVDRAEENKREVIYIFDVYNPNDTPSDFSLQFREARFR
jgi:hypothetical protein